MNIFFLRNQMHLVGSARMNIVFGDRKSKTGIEGIGDTAERCPRIAAPDIEAAAPNMIGMR